MTVGLLPALVLALGAPMILVEAPPDPPPLLDGPDQVLLIQERFAGEAMRQFVLYADGMVLFQKDPQIDESLLWSRAQLSEQDYQTLAADLSQPPDPAEPALALSGYATWNDVPRSTSDDYELPGLPSGVTGYAICSTGLGGKIKVWPTAGDGSPAEQEAPPAVVRFLALVERVRSLPARPWKPKWIDLVLEPQVGQAAVPPRRVPSEWLVGAQRYSRSLVRVDGERESAFHRLVSERRLARGSVTLPGMGQTARLQSVTAVLPGRPCDGRHGPEMGSVEALEPRYVPGSGWSAPPQPNGSLIDRH